MGENFNGIKLGTCENLYYVRRDELLKEIERGNIINMDSGNLPSLQDYLKLKHKWIYRFPKACEDNQSILAANKRLHADLLVFTLKGIEIPHNEKHLQATIEEITFNMPFCPLSKKAKESGFVAINHWGEKVEIVGEQYTEEFPEGFTLFRCAVCNIKFTIEPHEISIFQESMRKSGLSIEAERIKAK